MASLAAFVLAGLAGMWGVRQHTTTAEANGWKMEFAHAKTTRAGLAVPFQWTITRAGGFGEDETVVLRMTADYFDLFDENSFDPTPVSEWSDERYIYWELDTPPDSDTFTVGVDTRTGSAVQLTSKRGETAVLVDGQPAVSLSFRTWVMP